MLVRSLWRRSLPPRAVTTAVLDINAEATKHQSRLVRHLRRGMLSDQAAWTAPEKPELKQPETARH